MGKLRSRRSRRDCSDKPPSLFGLHGEINFQYHSSVTQTGACQFVFYNRIGYSVSNICPCTQLLRRRKTILEELSISPSALTCCARKSRDMALVFTYLWLDLTEGSAITRSVQEVTIRRWQAEGTCSRRHSGCGEVQTQETCSQQSGHKNLLTRIISVDTTAEACKSYGHVK